MCIRSYCIQSIKGAGEFCDRKMKLINENIDKLTRAFNVKRQNLEAILSKNRCIPFH